MKCKACEEKILSSVIDQDVLDHLSECKNCSLFESLLKSHEIKVNTDPSLIIESIKQAETIKQRKDLRAQFTFMILAACLLILVFFMLNSDNILWGQFLLASFMPIITLGISITRKAV